MREELKETSMGRTRLSDLVDALRSDQEAAARKGEEEMRDVRGEVGVQSAGRRAAEEDRDALRVEVMKLGEQLRAAKERAGGVRQREARWERQVESIEERCRVLEREVERGGSRPAHSTLDSCARRCASIAVIMMCVEQLKTQAAPCRERYRVATQDKAGEIA